MNSINNGYLMRYIDDTVKLVKTMVIKLDDAAKLMNEYVVLTYGESMFDEYSPETWKYYMNLSGQYHPTDTPMRIVSIDTLDEIDFTVENLRIHAATAEAYQYGSRQYYSLLRRYPDQEFLINGILLPADIHEAIEAKDGSILSYRKDLVESNEHSLIEELQAFIQQQIERWYVTQFNLAHDLYASVILAAIQSQLVTKVMNLRLKRCHTYEAHSFHVRMFLASHQGLDRYLPYLTLRQSLWLYRNIRYIERHAGILFQFNRLIDRLLTERGIPLGEYEVKQQDSFRAYIPDIIAISNPLNDRYNQINDNTLAVSHLFDKESEEAPGNEAYLKYNKEAQLKRFNLSPVSEVQTKVLHSSMVDLTNAVPDTFIDIALRQWCHMSMNGLYEAQVTFKDPITSQFFSLHAKDAFFYMVYLGMMRDGYTVFEVPEYLNMRQRRIPKPTVDDLLSVVDHKERDLRRIAQAIVTRQPSITECLSVDAFTRLINNLYQESYWHWFLISNTEDLYERGLIENMIHRLYEDERTRFTLSTTHIGDWLHSNNLPAYDYNRTESALLIKEIFEAGTGIKVDGTKTLKNVQRALIELFKELSSYTIQFIREINDNDLVIINWPCIRLGNQRMSAEYYVPVDNGVYTLNAPAGMVQSTNDTVKGNEVISEKIDIATNETLLTFDPVCDVHFSTSTAFETTDLNPGMLMTISYTGQNTVVDDKYLVPGISIYEALPVASRKQIKSIYHEEA